MKTIFFYISILVFLLSCNNREDIPTTPIVVEEKTLYNLTFANSYKVSSIVLYKGPNAIEQTPNEDFIKNTWNSYSVPEYKSIQIDLIKKTIHLKLGANSVVFDIEILNDFMYTVNNKILIGVLDRKNEKFELLKSFYYIKKDLANQGISFNRSTKLGLTKYSDIFGVNTFNNPSDMTSKNDELFWANLSFYYK